MSPIIQTMVKTLKRRHVRWEALRVQMMSEVICSKHPNLCNHRSSPVVLCDLIVEVEVSWLRWYKLEDFRVVPSDKNTWAKNIPCWPERGWYSTHLVISRLDKKRTTTTTKNKQEEVMVPFWVSSKCSIFLKHGCVYFERFPLKSFAKQFSKWEIWMGCPSTCTSIKISLPATADI